MAESPDLRSYANVGQTINSPANQSHTDLRVYVNIGHLVINPVNQSHADLRAFANVLDPNAPRPGPIPIR